MAISPPSLNKLQTGNYLLAPRLFHVKKIADNQKTFLIKSFFTTRIALVVSLGGFLFGFDASAFFSAFAPSYQNLGSAITFAIFGLFALIGFILIAKLLPETKGKSLEQIEKELVKH